MYSNKKWCDIPKLEQERIVKHSIKGPVLFEDLAFVNELCFEEVPAKLFFDDVWAIQCYYLFQGNGMAEIHINPQEPFIKTVSTLYPIQ